MTKQERLEVIETAIIVAIMALCVVPIKEINLFVNIIFPLFKWMGI